MCAIAGRTVSARALSAAMCDQLAARVTTVLGDSGVSGRHGLAVLVALRRGQPAAARALFRRRVGSLDPAAHRRGRGGGQENHRHPHALEVRTGRVPVWAIRSPIGRASPLDPSTDVHSLRLSGSLILEDAVLHRHRARRCRSLASGRQEA